MNWNDDEGHIPNNGSKEGMEVEEADAPIKRGRRRQRPRPSHLPERRATMMILEHPERLPGPGGGRPLPVPSMEVNTQKLWGIPENKLLTRAELTRLIGNVEGQEGDGYIRLVHSVLDVHPQFHPYHFKIVRDNQVARKKGHSDYFTLSKSGILHITGQKAPEFTSVPQFQMEMGLYDILLKIPFFANYRLWKGFTSWRRRVRRRKLTLYRTSLERTMLISKRTLGMALEELSNLRETLLFQTNFLKITNGLTYTLGELLECQAQHGRHILNKLRTFEGVVEEIIEEACRETLIEDGFDPETYEEEVKHLRELEQENRLVDKVSYPGEWLSYSEQAQKRHVCGRLTSFIRLLDYQVHYAYSQILRSSLVSMVTEFDKRSSSNDLPPLFHLKCCWAPRDHVRTNEPFVFTPPMSDFLEGVQFLFHNWRLIILSYENMVGRPSFNYFTKPIINGHMEPNMLGSGPSMELILENDSKSFSELLSGIKFSIRHGFQTCANHNKQFEHTQELCSGDENVDMTTETDPRVLSNLLGKYQDQMKLLEEIEDTKDLRIFRVDNSFVKEHAGPTIGRCLDALRKRIPELAADKATLVKEGMRGIKDNLTRFPATAEDYVEYLRHLEGASEEMKGIEMELWTCTKFHNLIVERSIQHPDDNFQLVFDALAPTFANLREIIKLKLGQNDILIEGLLQSFQIETGEMRQSMSEIRLAVEGHEVLDPASKSSEMVQKLGKATEELTVLREKADWLQLNEKKFNLDVSRFDDLGELIEFVNVRHQLWRTMAEFDKKLEEWEESPFVKINPDELEEQVKKYLNEVEELEEGALLPPNELIPLLRSKVEAMEVHLPWITCLRNNPNLSDRHWEELAKLFGVNFLEESVTLKQLLELGAMDCIGYYRKLGAQADTEHKLEAMLKTLEESWSATKFPVLPYKDSQTGLHILGEMGPLHNLLDESTAQLVTISGGGNATSPVVKQKVAEWTHRLQTFDLTLEQWKRCQRRWIQLEPILSTPDIKRRLPNEWKLFAQVNRGWKELMSKTLRSPGSLHAGASMGTLEVLQQNNELLDQVMKGLDDFLESKRIKFPRFYFISDEELLELLARTSSDPRAVQPFLHKFFGAIEKLEFGLDEKSKSSQAILQILEIHSPEGEGIELSKSVRTKGPVEDWIGKLEEGISSTVKKDTSNALRDYPKMNWSEWIEKHPIQVVLVISQLVWNQSVDTVLDGPSEDIPNALIHLQEEILGNLSKLGEMARGQLSPLTRTLISSLVIVGAYSRDIIGNITQGKVESSNDFEWLRHLRYGWDPNKELVSVSMATGTHRYGYEYIGASPRLVMTPLTNKAFLSLMLAIQLGLGGAVEGPSGMGKTETVKDLAEYLAYHCLVFNCFPGLDYQMLGRIFSGLAQTGGWACLDDLDKVDMGVLSVVAQQLQTIRLAKEHKLSRFIFEGREMKLVGTCSVFITMTTNPGARLPDNLKVLFRPVNMMVPDEGLITEVVMIAEGFKDFKRLGRKISEMFKLCRGHEISQLDHDNFGLRALRSLLRKAGELKRSNPEGEEDSLIVQALMESNMSGTTFVSDLVNDLFPGVDTNLIKQVADVSPLQALVERCGVERGLQISESFIQKIVQLHETMSCHHGVILVGQTGTGKTTTYEVLKEALTALSKDEMDGECEATELSPVGLYLVHPKVLSFGELYGEVNPLTQEWREGLLGKILKNAVAPRKEFSRQWIVFDGPVDPLWAENMNSLLDDNKMLCLPNLEGIKLRPWVHLLFEVDDLAQASPATVSRCGIVYSTNGTGDWKPYLDSWLVRQVDNREWRECLQNLCSKYLGEGLHYVKSHCNEVIPQSDVGKVSTVCSILESILLKEPSTESPNLEQVHQAFVFAYVWSIGGNLLEDSFLKLDHFVREQFQDEMDHFKLPQTGTLFEFYPNMRTQTLESWETKMPQYNPNSEMPLVPTLDTVRYGYLMELLLSANKAVLLTGDGGNGKSSIARQVLASISSSSESKSLSTYLQFSPGTSLKMTQQLIEANLNQTTRSLLKPPIGKKLIVMIEDLNTPKRDEYGAQPPLELIRQLLDSGGCYDREKGFWKHFQNVTFAGTCSLLGGPAEISTRLLRHFAILAVPLPSNATLTKIYQSIVRGIDKVRDEPITNLVSVLLQTYQFTRESFLPTPSRTHYIFNMHDLSRSSMGISQVRKDNLKTISSVNRLLCHELQRVFRDRLMTQIEQEDFNKNLAHFMGDAETPEELNKLVYGDFTEVEKGNRRYEEIKDQAKLIQVMKNYQDEFNNVNLTRQMSLIFFPEFASQVARLIRILRLDKGHALLLGVSGTGKRSMTRLATYISGCKLLQTSKTASNRYEAFRKDLRKLFEIAGVKNKPVVFLLGEGELDREEVLEDLNYILLSGEAPPGILEGDMDGRFHRNVRKNMHIVLSMNPAPGGTRNRFRRRCRTYPALVSRCTTMVISEWSDEALLFVANSLILKMDLGENVQIDKLCHISVMVHRSVTNASDRFWRVMKRRFHNPPSSYLEMLHLYSSLLEEEKEKIVSGKARIQNGLLKILETEELVKQMRIDLKSLEPVLIQKSQAVEDLMLVLSEDQAGADVVRRDVHSEESSAKEKASDTQAIAEDAQKDLAEALPALEAAVKSLDTLEKTDIVELKLFQKPPELVRTVMEAVCILFELKPDWATAKVLLADNQFLKKLYDFDKDNVSESSLKKLKVYMDNPNFTPKKIEKVSNACKSICMWVRAIDVYSKVFKTVEPKKSRYMNAQSDLDKVMDTLKTKQEQLNDVERRITSLRQRYEGSMKEKQDLVDNMELTGNRLRRAARLTTALASEQTKWTEAVDKFEERMKNLVGDVFVASACIAYFGCFTPEYRRSLVQEWVRNCVEIGIPVTAGFSMATFADPFEVRVWNSFGLPEDDTMTENAVVVTRSKRWPLIIDPEGYATAWIKQQEAERRLKVVSLSDGLSFIPVLAKYMRLGLPCLLEDIKDGSLNALLEPILLRPVYSRDGRSFIRFGGKDIPFTKSFRLYLSTSLENSQYPPQVWSRVTVINFKVTRSALENQFLGDVVKWERPDLESQRRALVTQINSDKNALISLENNILGLLFNSEGNILDDEILIDALHESKETWNQMGRRLTGTEVTDGTIHKAREKYRPIANRATILYFVVAQLTELNQMYQFSLKYFRQLFVQTVSSTEPTEELSERVNFLRGETTQVIFTNVCRGLFEKDKLVFSFLLCAEVLRGKWVIKEGDWSYFLHGGDTGAVCDPCPDNASWLEQNVWRSLCELEMIFDSFKGMKEAILENIVPVTIGFNFSVKLFQRPNISKPDHQWNKKLTTFQKLILIKSVWRERLEEAVTQFVCHELGQTYVESPLRLPHLMDFQMDLDKTTPLIFLLGEDGSSDPIALIHKFANELCYGDKLFSVSMGPGQEPAAERMIRAGMASGDWIFLQNCHLVPAWLPTLEQIVKSLVKRATDVHANFRLFLSSMATPIFPVSILQSGVKLAMEPPQGIRGNVRHALIQMDQDMFEHHILGNEWRKIVFGLCFFHAVIRERKRFDHSGWAINYEFGDGDRDSSLQILQRFCTETIPWKTLEYTVAELIYGGRVADQWDQRCLGIILKTFFSSVCLKLDHVYSKLGVYKAPDSNSILGYIEHVEELPITDELDIFGMDDNAVTAFQRKKASLFLSTLRTLQPHPDCQRNGGGENTANQDGILLNLVEDLEAKLPPNLNHEDTHPNHFALADDPITPLTLFLQQEIDSFNRLLDTIRQTLTQLRNAVKGVKIMSDNLEEMQEALLNNQVPNNWKLVSYLSMETLSSWYSNLFLRVDFIRTWQTGSTPPSSFWLSSFFSPQSFFTAILQTHSQKYGLPLEKLTIQYIILPILKTDKEGIELDPVLNLDNFPQDGVLIHGLFLEAASFDMEHMVLAESFPGQMWTPFPILHLLPSLRLNPSEDRPESDPHQKESSKNMYTCPLYKTSLGNKSSWKPGRDAGNVIASNFITFVNLPTNHPQEYWIIRKTALVTEPSPKLKHQDF